MKDSTGLGLSAIVEITLSAITAAVGIPILPEFFAGVGGFFVWGALEAKEDEIA